MNATKTILLYAAVAAAAGCATGPTAGPKPVPPADSHGRAAVKPAFSLAQPILLRNKKFNLYDGRGNSLGAVWYDEWTTPDGIVVRRTETGRAAPGETAGQAATAAKTDGTDSVPKNGLALVRACLSKAGFRMPGVVSDGDRPIRKTLDDFVDVLNAKTWGEFEDATKHASVENIADIHLPGVSDPMIFLRTESGSILGSTIYVLRRDPETGTWIDLHRPLEDGCVSDMVLIPVEEGGRTWFLSVEIDFVSKLQTGFCVFDYDPETDEWNKAASARVRHSFRLSDEDRAWISETQVSDIVTNGLPAGHRHHQPVDIPAGRRTVRLLPFETSNGYSTDGYFASVLDGNTQVWPERDSDSFSSIWPGRFVRGFLPVERGGRRFVVLLDYSHCESGFGIGISVLDTDSLETIHEHVASDDLSLEPDVVPVVETVTPEG